MCCTHKCWHSTTNGDEELSRVLSALYKCTEAIHWYPIPHHQYIPCAIFRMSVRQNDWLPPGIGIALSHPFLFWSPGCADSSHQVRLTPTISSNDCRTKSNTARVQNSASWGALPLHRSGHSDFSLTLWCPKPYFAQACEKFLKKTSNITNTKSENNLVH